MPFTMNGVGTSVCCSRGDIGDGSSDAMECFVLFFMPIIPYRAMHTFDWNGEQYRHIPIRWSWDLTLRTFVKPWSWGFIALGAVLLLIGVLEISKGKGPGVPLTIAGTVMVGAGVMGLILLQITDHRNKAIRRMIAGLTIGSCDPAQLTGKLLDDIKGNPKTMYETETFADAVEKQLAQGAFAQAMWAARMTVAVEDKHEGERLTNEVLAYSGVAEAIAEVTRNPNNWAKVMLSEKELADLEARIAAAQAEEEAQAKKKRRRQDDEDY
jgi:hypothetical protein